MASPLARSYGWGCATQLIAAVVGLIVAVPLVVGTLVLAIVLPRDGPWIWVLTIALCMALLVTLSGLGLAFGLWNRRRIARIVDEALEPLGLEASAFGLVGRQYHGVVLGRRVDATLNRGPCFDMYVEAPARTRLGVAKPNVLSRTAASAYGHSEVPCEPLSALGLLVVALDPVWAKGLLGRPDVVDGLVRLARPDGLAWVRSVGIRPDAIHLLLHRIQLGDITPERVRDWHADLHLVAEAVSVQLAPENPVEVSNIELLIRTEPNRIRRWGVLIGVGIVAVITLVGLCMGVLGVALALSTK